MFIWQSIFLAKLRKYQTCSSENVNFHSLKNRSIMHRLVYVLLSSISCVFSVLLVFRIFSSIFVEWYFKGTLSKVFYLRFFVGLIPVVAITIESGILS